MNIPSWWEAFLLAAASWRSWQLVAHDDFFDWPRRRALRLGNWQQDGDPIPREYRAGIGEWLKCPYCAGAWAAITWWAAWQIWPHATLVVAVPFALSTGVIALARLFTN